MSLRTAREKLNRKLRRLKAKFTTHPRETGRGYWRHLGYSWKCSVLSMGVAVQFLVHGVFPFYNTELDREEVVSDDQNVA